MVADPDGNGGADITDSKPLCRDRTQYDVGEVAGGLVDVLALGDLSIQGVEQADSSGHGGDAVGTDTGSQEPAAVTGTFDVGAGRQMYIECHGAGSSTVVLVAGARSSAEVWSMTSTTPPALAVFPEVEKFTRVCADDRPETPLGGEPTSRSELVQQPTNAAAGVDDLHALLQAAGEAGPYVLVGDSFGGLIAKPYAHTYPDDVSGLVLIDALSEGLQDGMTPAQWEIQLSLFDGDLSAALVEYPDLEQLDVERSFEQIRAAPPLQPIPLVVLSADQSLGPVVAELIAEGMLPDSVPPDFGFVVDEAQQRAQAALAQLVPTAKHVTNTDSGHNDHNEQPQLVIDAIREVVDAVRQQSPPPAG